MCSVNVAVKYSVSWKSYKMYVDKLVALETKGKRKVLQAVVESFRCSEKMEV